MKLKSPLKWFGGKGRIASRITKYIPSGGRPYCEPYAGGASLFFYRERADAEVLNDLHQDLITLYRCLQDPERFPRLRHAINWTLHSRAEFGRALEILNGDEQDAIKRAWAMLVAHKQAFSGDPGTIGDWGRTIKSTPSWPNLPDRLDAIHDRLRGVQIDCRDALEVIQYWDNEEAVFYVDPPYLHATRVEKNGYKHEADDQHHIALVKVLLNVKGCATLSCYFHEIYQPLLDAGWRRVDLPTVCDAAVRTRASKLQGTGHLKRRLPRVETLLINPQACARLDAQNAPLTLNAA